MKKYSYIFYHITENDNSDSNKLCMEKNKQDKGKQEYVIDKMKDIMCLCPGKYTWDSHLRGWFSYPPIC